MKYGMMVKQPFSERGAWMCNCHAYGEAIFLANRGLYNQIDENVCATCGLVNPKLRIDALDTLLDRLENLVSSATILHDAHADGGGRLLADKAKRVEAKIRKVRKEIKDYKHE